MDPTNPTSPITPTISPPFPNAAPVITPPIAPTTEDGGTPPPPPPPPVIDGGAMPAPGSEPKKEDVEVAVSGGGKGPAKKKWGAGVLVGSMAALMVLVVGLGFGIWQVRQKQDIKAGKAWSGQGLDKSELQKRKELASQTLVNFKPYATFDTRIVYDNLVKASPDAEVISFREETVGLVGTAYMKYAPEIGKTFVFSRIVGIPHPNTGLIRLWITKDEEVYEPVGVVEFTYEPNVDKPVGYSVFVSEKDLRKYKKLIFSYDSTTALSKPDNFAIVLDF